METIEDRISRRIREGRALAWKSVDGIMEETYVEIAGMMAAEKRRQGGNPLRFRGSLEGVSSITLNEISDCSDFPSGLHDVLFNPQLHHRRADFTGFRKMAMDNVKARYANAFDPWSEEDDRRLTSMREDGWTVRDIAEVLQRNPHAIALRLEHIGKK